MVAGIAVCLVYVALLLALQRRSKVPYPEIGKNAHNLGTGLVIPVAIMTGVLVAFAVITGRLLPAFSVERVDAAWLWVIPVVLGLMIIVQFARARWSMFDRRAVILMVIGTALVGLSEELLVRGILVEFLQESGLELRWVAIVSSVVFGLLHGVNILSGQSVQTTLVQVLLTSLLGLALFGALMVSGTLWLPIAIHCLLDFSVLARGGTLNEDDERPPLPQIVLTLLLYALALGSLFAY